MKPTAPKTTPPSWGTTEASAPADPAPSARPVFARRHWIVGMGAGALGIGCGSAPPSAGTGPTAGSAPTNGGSILVPPGSDWIPAAATSGPLRRIGVASCTDQTQDQPIWTAALAQRPDLFIFAGDNVYASQQPWQRATLQAAYTRQASVPGFAKLRREVPHLAIWDDHDYGLNDGGAEFAHKSESKDEFMRFWQVSRGDPRRTRDGIYHAQIYGPVGQRVQVILLDTRWFRSAWKPTDQRNAPGKERFLPDADPAKTMLGEVQWRWLAEQLRQPAEIRVIVSGIQVVADGHGWECWALMPRERTRLYDLIRQTQAAGVVFFSGDRHIGAIYEERRGTPYPMLELTSSGVTHPWRTANEAGPNRVALYTEPHFATLDVDWSARKIELALRGADGTAQRTHSRLLTDLKA